MDEWIPISWCRKDDLNKVHRITIELVTSPFYSGQRYAIRDGSRCLNKEGVWEYEPPPSTRNQAFYERCRFNSFTDAIVALQKGEK